MSADESLVPSYFDGIFEGDDDPWSLASSAYERAKFDRTIAVLDDRRYDRAFESGVRARRADRAAERRFAGTLLSIDISAAAIAQARRRLAGKDDVTFAKMAFPRDAPQAEASISWCCPRSSIIGATAISRAPPIGCAMRSGRGGG